MHKQRAGQMVRGGNSFAHLILIHHHNSVRALSHVHLTYSLVRFMQGIQKKPTEQDVQLIFTIQPCQHSWFFKQAWRNKSALGWEDLCQVFHPKCVLIGSQLKLFKKQYLMKTNRCITAEYHRKTVNMYHHQVLIAKLKKKTQLRVMTGKYCCYRSPASTNTIFPAERSSYAQTGRAPVSASACTLTRTAPTRGLLSSPCPYPPRGVLLPSRCSSSPPLLQGGSLLRQLIQQKSLKNIEREIYIYMYGFHRISYLNQAIQHSHPTWPAEERGYGWKPLRGGGHGSLWQQLCKPTL